MVEFFVRDVSDDLIQKLRRRAAARGRSVEAELRAILQAALEEPAESPPQVSERVRRALAGEITIDDFSEAEVKAFFTNLGTSMLTPREDERAYYASLPNPEDAPGLPDEAETRAILKEAVDPTAPELPERMAAMRRRVVNTGADAAATIRQHRDAASEADKRTREG